jgi:hypothetical protein
MLPQPDADVSALTAIQDPAERRQFVGNAIYSSIEAAYGPNAGKITGMLLDENVVDFTSLLTNQPYLSQKAREAMNLIQVSQAQ